MKIKYLSVLVALFIFSGFSTEAQTLFTYGNHSVSQKEFMTNFQKGGSNDTTGISDYLDLYALFKMKVQAALDMKMDTTSEVINELNRYKAQLARTKLVDKTVTERLVKEAYERMKSDIKVAHILIAVKPNEEAVSAKKTIDSLYQLLTTNKANFTDLAKAFSDDQTSASSGGEVGYITALQTPYPFESAAYNTAVGQISKPFRTIYGYHILKVEKKRVDPGKIQVAQILISSPEYDDEATQQKAKALAEEIESKLNKGANFFDLVAQYSDDRYTKNTNGVMPPFGIGEMTPNFEKAAYGLKKPGDISAPVHTVFGYHIIKLIKQIPLQPLDSLRYQLTQKVKNDSREMKAKKVYFEKVKEKYHFKEYPQNFQQVLAVTGKDTSRNLSPKRYPGLTKTLFELDGKPYKQSDLLAYVYKLTKGKFIGRKKGILTDLYSSYTNQSITDLQQQKLMENDPEYRSQVEEYKNGILLFDLMDKRVWSKASKDTTGLQAFYQKNKANYKWQPGFTGTLFYCNNKAPLKKLHGYLNQGEDVQVAMNMANKGLQNGDKITSETGRYLSNKIPVKDLKSNQATAVFQNAESGKYGLAYISKFNPEIQQKTLEEARGFVMADYQDYLKIQWEKELRQTYPLKINERLLHKIEKRQD